MKIVNLNEYIAGTNLVETSAEALKNINGGCTITIGRCKKDGSYFVQSVSKKCSHYSSHVTKALVAAKTVGLPLGGNIVLPIQ